MVKSASFTNAAKLRYGVRTAGSSESAFVESEGRDVLKLNARHLASMEVVAVVANEKWGSCRVRRCEVSFKVALWLTEVAILAIVGTRTRSTWRLLRS